VTSPGDALLVHGFTLGHVEWIARWAVGCHRNRGGYVQPDAYDIAYGGVAEALYAAEQTPTLLDLIRAGVDTLKEEIRTDMKAHGRHPSRPGVGPRYVAYWWGQRVTHFPEDRIIDRIALVEILPLLTKRQCEAVVAFAATGSSDATAEALGISVKTARNHLVAARHTFRLWWHEHETPAAFRGLAATCRNGHDRAEYEVIWAGRRFCRRCHQQTAKRGYWNSKGAAA
jgi:DNA-binding CsgD family transcriptional regulator